MLTPDSPSWQFKPDETQILDNNLPNPKIHKKKEENLHNTKIKPHMPAKFMVKITMETPALQKQTYCLITCHHITLSAWHGVQQDDVI